MNVDRLVEQARVLVHRMTHLSQFTDADIVAGLADAVEQLEGFPEMYQQEARLADEARARVADLEAFVSRLANEDFRGNEPQHVRDAKALLGRSIGQETDGV